MIDFETPETHDTLPGTPHPAVNPQLFGHNAILAELGHAFRAGRLHHGLLFEGPQGVGKATLAFHLANHILASRDPADASETPGAPDPASPIFRQVAQNVHPSLRHITRPRNDKETGWKTAITVEEIRKIGRFMAMTAGDGLHRIVIIDSAGDMNRNAANALLKSLEEPPPRALFILISHGSSRLLPTVRSRCQSVSFQPLGDDDLSRAFAAATGAPPDKAVLSHAEGSVRRALLFAGYGGTELAAAFDRIVNARAYPVAEAYKLATAASARGEDIPFRLVSDHALARIRESALAAARAGNLRGAARLAETESAFAARLAEATAYNLDRKEEMLRLIAETHRALN